MNHDIKLGPANPTGTAPRRLMFWTVNRTLDHGPAHKQHTRRQHTRLTNAFVWAPSLPSAPVLCSSFRGNSKWGGPGGWVGRAANAHARVHTRTMRVPVSQARRHSPKASGLVRWGGLRGRAASLVRGHSTVRRPNPAKATCPPHPLALSIEHAAALPRSSNPTV